jgi:transcriptional regulator with XRE-family HTH domain
MKIIRLKHGVTQKDLAERLGIRQATLCNVENGKIQTPNPKLMAKISRELNTPVDELLKEA